MLLLLLADARATPGRTYAPGPNGVADATFDPLAPGSRLQVGADAVNLRAGPDVGTAVVARLPLGAAVTVVAPAGDPVVVQDRRDVWYAVRDRPGVLRQASPRDPARFDPRVPACDGPIAPFGPSAHEPVLRLVFPVEEGGGPGPTTCEAIGAAPAGRIARCVLVIPSQDEATTSPRCSATPASRSTSTRRRACRYRSSGRKRRRPKIASGGPSSRHSSSPSRVISSTRGAVDHATRT